MKVRITVRPGDKLQISDQIELTLSEIGETQARFLLELPPHTPVFKQENYRTFQIENRRSASSSEKRVKEMVRMLRDYQTMLRQKLSSSYSGIS